MWIEIQELKYKEPDKYVTSFAEVWIEIETGDTRDYVPNVTSFAEVWIEIRLRISLPDQDCVTSFAEVWIEILQADTGRRHGSESLPSRKCGLKSMFSSIGSMTDSHFLRGSVD